MSGQTPLHPDTNVLVQGGIEVQTRQVFANLERVLAAAGPPVDDVIKVNAYLTDMADLPAMNAIHGSVFTEPYSARTTVAVAGLPLGVAVEVELVARAR